MRRARSWLLAGSIFGTFAMRTPSAHAQSSPPPASESPPPSVESPAPSPAPASSASSPPSASSSPAPSATTANDVARVRVHFDADEPGAALGEVTAFGRPVHLLCPLPCVASVPADVRGPRRLVFRRASGRQVMVDMVRFDEGASVRLGYVSNWRWRVAGGVVLGAHAVALTVALSVLIASHFDFTFGTGPSSDGGLGFAYGFAVGIFLGVPLAMLITPDRAAVRRVPASAAP